MLIVGVDGCPAGWIAAAVDLIGQRWEPRVFPTLATLVEAYPLARAIAVDIPIGLAESGARRCDELARRRLGPRRSSVFTPPSRHLLRTIERAPDYRAANRLCRAGLGHGIGVQAFNIYPKIRERDHLVTPELQERIVEVHPELCFTALRGEPCFSPKRTPPGAAERLDALRRGCAWLGDVAPWAPRGAAPDDLLDALVAAWTAERLATGRAERLPSMPEHDGRGLRMEMVF